MTYRKRLAAPAALAALATSALGPRSRRLGAGLALGTLLLATPVQAQSENQPPRQRAELELELRRVFSRAVRERVGLTEEQMQRLGPLTQKHERQRRQLQMEERRTRLALQSQLRSADPDTAEVSRLLATLLDVHRRRLQTMEMEHADLATVMSPVQRARYLALQEQVRRRVEQMRQRRPRR